MTATISIMTMGQQWRCLMSLKKQPVRTKNSFLIRSILLLVRSMYKMPELPTPLCKQYFLSALEYFHNIITSLHNYSYSLQWWVRYVVQSGTLNCYAATSSRLYHADTPIFHVNYWAELDGPQVLRVPAVITLTWICLFATNPFCRTSSSTNMQLLPYPNEMSKLIIWEEWTQ